MYCDPEVLSDTLLPFLLPFPLLLFSFSSLSPPTSSLLSLSLPSSLSSLSLSSRSLSHSSLLPFLPPPILPFPLPLPSQLYAAISEHVPPEKLNLDAGSSLLTSLKQCVVELARNSNVLETVQQAAQAVLRSGWMILLPTVSERASALSQLLPVGEGTCVHVCGRWEVGGSCA